MEEKQTFYADLATDCAE